MVCGETCDKLLNPGRTSRCFPREIEELSGTNGVLFTGRFGFGRASFSEPTSERPSHDPSHRTAALCLDVHAVAMVAPIGAAARGAQKPIGRPRSPPSVASAARRPTGRIGRLPGDPAVSVSTSAAVLVRAWFLFLGKEDRSSELVSECRSVSLS